MKNLVHPTKHGPAQSPEQALCSGPSYKMNMYYKLLGICSKSLFSMANSLFSVATANHNAAAPMKIK